MSNPLEELWNIDDEEIAEYKNLSNHKRTGRFSDELKIMEALHDDDWKLNYVIHKMLSCCEADRRFIGLMLLDYLGSCDQQEIKGLINELKNPS